MPRIGGKVDYWADGSVAFFDTSGTNYKNTSQHRDYSSTAPDVRAIDISIDSYTFGKTFYSATSYPTTFDYYNGANYTYFWQINATS